MKHLFVILGILLSCYAYSQNTHYVEITPQIQAKLKAEVEQEIPKFKANLLKKEIDPESLEFDIDTFRINRFVAKWINLNDSDASMSEATYAQVKLYDGLLNKYYKKVLAKLKPEDKGKLVQAQRAWIVFRDSESNFQSAVEGEIFGSGTAGQLNEAGAYLTLIKKRVDDMFNYLNDLKLK